MSVGQKVRSIFNHLPETFVPEKAKGIKANIQINLSGEGGGNWLLNITNSQLTVEERQIKSPDLALSMSAKDYVDLTLGNANPMALFFTGKVQMDGSMILAWKMREMFDPDQVKR